jgi:cation diffusion facilitator CzcD-associated flavoprotein CzcO
MEALDPHTLTLPRFQTFSKQDDALSPKDIASGFLGKFNTVLQQGSEQLSSVLHEESWWRDHLMLSWDLRTLHTLAKIQDFLGPRLLDLGFEQWRLADPFKPSMVSATEGLDWVEFSVDAETKIARGRAIVRLTQGADLEWKAFTIYTCVTELKGYEENVGPRRPLGGKNSLEGGIVKGNWLERRQREKEFPDETPTVLAIGAGQAGLNIGARLRALGISCLLIDRNERIGDNWRNRYRTLVTHDPVHSCHMAYLPFPPNWPFFTPKDKLADFFEAYASLMELNVWTSTSIISSAFDKSTSTWTIDLKRGDGTIRTIKPRHIIFCTGHSGEAKIPAFDGQEAFEARQRVYHASQHRDASQCPVSGKKVVVVGTGNSGHDIAQNFCENGAEVTMVQRDPTYVIGSDVGLKMLLEPLYGEDSPATEDADLYASSFPNHVGFALGRDSTKRIAEAEKDILEGLKNAGFRLSMGVGGSGIMATYLTKGGGYYIDVGASKLIADGKIKIAQSPQGIKCFDSDGLVLATGQKLPADTVVLATGYDNMRTSLRKALGDEVADQCKDVWGLDDEGEINAVSPRLEKSLVHPARQC